jgi:hypothetical protein
MVAMLTETQDHIYDKLMEMFSLTGSMWRSFLVVMIAMITHVVILPGCSLNLGCNENSYHIDPIRCPPPQSRKEPNYIYSPNFYLEVTKSWEGRQIEDLINYGNWGNPVRSFGVCPKDCKGWRGDVSKVYTWNESGYDKPPKRVWDDRFYGFKDDYSDSERLYCKTQVGVDAKGKIIQMALDQEDFPYEKLIFRLWKGDECEGLIRAGEWSPKVAPGWYGSASDYTWPGLNLLRSWMGRQVNEMIKHWGKPAEIRNLSQKDIKSYISKYTGGDGQSVWWRAKEGALTCSINFFVDDQGKIFRHNLKDPTPCGQMKSVKAKWRAAPEAPPAKKPAT